MYVDERRTIPGSARQDRLSGVASDRLVVRKIHPFVVIEIRAQGDVHQSLQSSWPARLNCRNARDGSLDKASIADNPKTADAFGYQHVSVRKESDGPRLL
jgi:hypothetical protein